MLLFLFLAGPGSPRTMKTCPKRCRVNQNQCFAQSVLFHFWIAFGLPMAPISDFFWRDLRVWGSLGRALSPPMSLQVWTFWFFFTMDSRGPPLTRNGAPGHPKAHQNDFKMVPRGSKIVALFVSSVWFACFLCFGFSYIFSAFVLNCFSYVCLFCLSHCMSIAFLNQVESRAARSAARRFYSL